MSSVATTELDRGAAPMGDARPRAASELDSAPACAAGARALGQSVKLLYLSNAEEYLYYTPDFVANVRALPAGPGSLVLRTIHDRFEGWESCGDGDRRWNYQVQPLVDFQARLGDRKNTARTAMLARANDEKVIDRVARGVSVFRSPAP